MSGSGSFNSDDVYKAGTNVLASYAAAALQKFGLGANYKGRMGARGFAMAQAKQAQFAFRQQLIQQKIGFAETEFAQTNPFEPGQLFLSPENLPPALAKMTAKATAKLTRLGQVAQTKAVVKKERKLNAKLERLANKAAPYTQVRVGELYGANAGYWRERGAPAPLFLSQGSH